LQRSVSQRRYAQTTRSIAARRLATPFGTRSASARSVIRRMESLITTGALVVGKSDCGACNS
jgi:hypothetical protein